jgi:hypothetical protein
MTSIRMARYAGWSAYGSAAAGVSGSLLVLAVFILDARVGDLVTPLGIASMVELLALLPVALVLHQFNRARAPTLSRLVLAIGLVGLLVAASLQALFVARAVPLEHQASLSMTAFGLIGLWLLVGNQLGRSHRILPARLAWLGAVLGAGQLVALVSFVIIAAVAPGPGGGTPQDTGGYVLRGRGFVGVSSTPVSASPRSPAPNDPLLIGAILGAGTGGLLWWVAHPVWTIWLGRLLVSARRITASPGPARPT